MQSATKTDDIILYELDKHNKFYMRVLPMSGPLWNLFAKLSLIPAGAPATPPPDGLLQEAQTSFRFINKQKKKKTIIF